MKPQKHTIKQAAENSWMKDEYLVAVKLLLRDGDRLLITHDIYGQWDVPGGRIRKDQFKMPLEDILKTKVAEELGSSITYEITGIKATFRVEREEVGREGEVVRIFGIGYEANLTSGEVELGEYHDKFEWINIKTADLSEYASPSGWVEQLADYQMSVNTAKDRDS